MPGSWQRINMGIIRDLLARRRQWSRPAAALLLVTAIVLACQPVWKAGFIWDDDEYVTKNPLLTAPDGLQRIWFSTDAPSQYCPLVYTSFWIERRLWGLDPAGYHWTNIVLHCANALLVWLLLQRLKVPGPWLGAALFGLHPVNVESVAWISERKNVLSMFFCFLALLEWIRFVDRPGRRRPEQLPEPASSDRPVPCRHWSPYFAALGFYALALFSKSTACTLSAALLLVLWLKHKPVTLRRLGQVAPFVALGLGMGLLTIWWERVHQGTAGKEFAIGWLERILIASRAIWFYLGKMAWPVHLTFSYPKWNIDPKSVFAYGWLIASAVAGWLIIKGRKLYGRGVETAAVFYVATLSPLLGFFMLYTFRYTFVADHYQYVASVGPLALVGAALTVFGCERSTLNARADLCGRVAASTRSAGLRPIALLFTGIILISAGTLTRQQCQMFKDSETLWRATISRNPQSYMAHNNLGAWLLRNGHTDEAILEFKRVLALQPEYEIGHYNLGNALMQKGLISEAVSELEAAIRLKPDYAAAHNNLGNVLLRNGRPREAVEHYETAARLRPKNADAANNLAWVLATSPDASIRDGTKAVTLARKAEQLSHGRDPVHIATLAAAYAETGRFEEAIVAVRRAQAIASFQGNTGLGMALMEQANFYAERKPFRDTGTHPWPAR